MWKYSKLSRKGADKRMAKDRIDRDELASKLVEVASIAEDP
jgi:hypothetical protein